MSAEFDLYISLREKMVSEQIVARDIKNQQVIDAFRKVPRHKFVDSKFLSEAYSDHPLPLTMGQTISQPYIVALMTELLEVYEDEKVLEIGTGSGYQTAILAELADTVHSVERLPELSQSAQKTLQELGYKNIQFHISDGSAGWLENAPYDRIIVTASAPNIPQPLIDQLKENGKIVIPLGSNFGQDLVVGEKHKGELKIFNYGKVVFVPLIGAFGWHDEKEQ
ncbi:MAG: protein-L-isoaspartate(D-aspartate) O-methyltransferase [bacterium]|nr:protein-L-isoaspartate(D-aspartate) O-methyltransferase [bacterium]